MRALLFEHLFRLFYCFLAQTAADFLVVCRFFLMKSHFVTFLQNKVKKRAHLNGVYGIQHCITFHIHI